MTSDLNKKRFCTHCGQSILSTDKFCAYCGNALFAEYKTKRSSFFKKPLHMLNSIIRRLPLFFAVKASAICNNKKILLYAVCSAALLFVLMTASSLYLVGSLGNIKLIPSVAISVWNNGWGERLRPDVIQPSGSKAVNTAPLPGITLNAKEDALDKTRSFSMREVPVEQLSALPILPTKHTTGVICKAFELDGKMSAGERFRDSLDLIIDLAKQDIPKSLWENVTLLHYNPESGLKTIPVKHDNNKLEASLRHNGTLILAVSLPFMGDGTAEIVDNGVLQNIKKLSGTVPTDADSSLVAVNFKDKKHFRILLPVNMQSSNPAAVQKALNTLNTLKKTYQIDENNVLPPTASGSTSLNADGESPRQKQINNYISTKIQRLEAMKSDPAYKALLAETSNDEWIIKNFLPDQARYTLEALENAWNYLVDKRSFKEPSYIIDTYILNNISSSAFAETCNPKLASPLLIFNTATIPDNKKMQTDAGKKEYQELRATAVHELFHIITTQYYWYDSNSYLWFAEATAVTVENEAKSAWSAVWDGTTRDYETYTQPLDLQEGNAAILQSHGYGASYFLEYLRNNYYAANKDTFLTALLTDFGTSKGDNVESLFNVTSKSAKTFADDYKKFSLLHANDIARFPKDKVDPLQYFYNWKRPDTAIPLSNEILKVSIPISAEEKSDPPILIVIKKHATPDFDLSFWFLKGAPQIITKDAYMAFPATNDSKVIAYLQRINNFYAKRVQADYYNGWAFPSELGGTYLYVMRKPQAKPELSIKNEKLVITLGKTSELNSEAFNLVKTVALKIIAKGNGWSKDETLELELAKNGAPSYWEIPLDKLRGSSWKSYIPGITEKPDDDITYTVSYREIADVEGKPKGPASDTVSISTQTGKQALIGSWNGNTTITDINSLFLDLLYEAVKEHQKTFTWWMNNPWAFQGDPEKYKQRELAAIKGAKILIGKPFKIKMKFLQPDKNGLVQFYCQIINPELGEKNNEVVLFAGEGEWDENTFNGDGFFPSHAYSIYIQIRKELRESNVDKYIPNLVLERFRKLAKKTGITFGFTLTMPNEQKAKGTITVSAPFFSEFATFSFDADKSAQENWPEFKGF